jgi:hypothetical protein
MALNVSYVAGDGTPLITADAFRVRLRQSGFAVRSERVDGDEIELALDGVVLWLFVENGFVVEVEAEVTFVDDRKSTRLLDLIESMGWVPVED